MVGSKRFRIFLISIVLGFIFLVLSGPDFAQSDRHPLDVLYRDFTGSALQPAPTGTLLRRLSLQLRGNIPKYNEVKGFEKSRASTRVSKYAEKYIQDPDFAHYWGTAFGSMFRDQTSGWRRKHGAFFRYLSQSLHENKSYRKMVREMLTATGNEEDNPAAGFYLRDEANPLQIAEFVGRVFYAKKVGCARCHDHPQEDFTRRDYYGLAAFFGQQYAYHYYRKGLDKDLGLQHVEWKFRDRLPTSVRKEMEAAWHDWNRTTWKQMSKEKRKDYNKNNQLKLKTLFYHPDLGVRFPRSDDAPGGDLVKPKFPDGKRARVKKGKDRRKVFAKWLTRKKNERFRKVIVNRIWTRLMGWSFFYPLDDWNDKTKIQGEKLLNHLSGVFLANDYRIKDLVYYIVTSKAYARRAPPPGPAAKNQALVYFSPQRLDADQLMNSLLRGSRAMRVPHVWERAGLFHDPANVDLKGRGPLLAPKKRDRKGYGNAAEVERPANYHSFLSVFGAGRRMDVSDDESEPTIEQIMTLMNGNMSGRVIWNFGGKDSFIRKEFETHKSMEKVYQTVFRGVLSRNMTEQERSALKRITTPRFGRRKKGFEQANVQDLLWSLFNSQEFLHVY